MGHTQRRPPASFVPAFLLVVVRRGENSQDSQRRMEIPTTRFRPRTSSRPSGNDRSRNKSGACGERLARCSISSNPLSRGASGFDQPAGPHWRTHNFTTVMPPKIAPSSSQTNRKCRPNLPARPVAVPQSGKEGGFLLLYFLSWQASWRGGREGVLCATFISRVKAITTCILRDFSFLFWLLDTFSRDLGSLAVPGRYKAPLWGTNAMVRAYRSSPQACVAGRSATISSCGWPGGPGLAPAAASGIFMHACLLPNRARLAQLSRAFLILEFPTGKGSIRSARGRSACATGATEKARERERA